jgi:DNA-binding MarR family transcriptional regulator
MVYNARMTDKLHEALMDLMAALNSPQADQFLLRTAGVEVDRALFPLLVRIGLYGPIGVTELAEQVGRDHSTVSRQMAKMEALGLVKRTAQEEDQRLKAAALTTDGQLVVDTLARARRQVFREVLRDWTEEDKLKIAELTRALADDITRVTREARSNGK